MLGRQGSIDGRFSEGVSGSTCIGCRGARTVNLIGLGGGSLLRSQFCCFSLFLPLDKWLVQEVEFFMVYEAWLREDRFERHACFRGFVRGHS